jgi:hypothetical protein
VDVLLVASTVHAALGWIPEKRRTVALDEQVPLDRRRPGLRRRAHGQPWSYSSLLAPSARIITT